MKNVFKGEMPVQDVRVQSTCSERCLLSF